MPGIAVLRLLALLCLLQTSCSGGRSPTPRESEARQDRVAASFPDADGDRIPDDEDACPLEPEVDDGCEIRDGCPGSHCQPCDIPHQCGEEPPTDLARGEEAAPLPAVTPFPCEEDVSAIGDALAEYSCWSGNEMFTLPHPLAICIRTGNGGSEIEDRLLLHRNDHRWELLQLPRDLNDEQIGDALLTDDGALYLALRKQIYRIDRQGRRTTLRSRGMRHPAGIWGCGDGVLIAASVDRIERHYYWEWDAMYVTGFPGLYRSGVLRVHVIGDDRDCVLPRASMMPMFLECGGDRPTLHVLTHDRDDSTTRCGLRVRRHALKPLWGSAYPAGLSFGDARILFCRSTSCEDGPRTICNVDFLEAMPEYENRLIEIDPDGDSVAAPRPGEKAISVSMDAIPGCDGVIYSPNGDKLVDREWISSGIAHPDRRVADSNAFFDEHGVLITIGVEGIGRIHGGRLEPVILWKEHRPMMPGHP